MDKYRKRTKTDNSDKVSVEPTRNYRKLIINNNENYILNNQKNINH